MHVCNAKAGCSSQPVGKRYFFPQKVSKHLSLDAKLGKNRLTAWIKIASTAFFSRSAHALNSCSWLLIFFCYAASQKEHQACSQDTEQDLYRCRAMVITFKRRSNPIVTVTTLLFVKAVLVAHNNWKLDDLKINSATNGLRSFCNLTCIENGALNPGECYRTYLEILTQTWLHVYTSILQTEIISC